LRLAEFAILLSFAQFEREVTGERIRDKIAASKKKGMWMGGMLPLGYDVEGRKLVPNPKETQLVSKIFELYLQLGWVSKLAKQLNREKIRSKVWITRTGARLGGVPFARGALYDRDARVSRLQTDLSHAQHSEVTPTLLWDKNTASRATHFRGDGCSGSTSMGKAATHSHELCFVVSWFGFSSPQCFSV
jgi:site-specific DNA recombinase